MSIFSASAGSRIGSATYDVSGYDNGSPSSRPFLPSYPAILTISPQAAWIATSGLYALYNSPDSTLLSVSGSDFQIETSADVTIASVPEPSTWATLLIGFVGVGFAARYRHRTYAALLSHIGSLSFEEGSMPGLSRKLCPARQNGL
jgi:hypothetical protein